ncbi:MAG: UMP kinase [Oscillospiraceae bacterium]|jgi:uridylate kinase|nr:UMP kinase [Oscillospiraceae bacterium]
MYNRVILKLSGEALCGSREFGIDFNIATEIGRAVKRCVDLETQIGIVIGGGNFWRGRDKKMKRVTADRVGMIATVMNALIFAEILQELNIDCVVQTSIPMVNIAEFYIIEKAVKHLENGKVVIFACGTGGPFFSTDTAAALRACEVGAEIVFKATMTDGVYDSDPKKNLFAKKYEKISLKEVLEKNLGVMDSAAAAICKENNIPIQIFSISDPDNIAKAIAGNPVGTFCF